MPVPTPEDKKALIALEKTLWRAETRFDIAHMEHALTADFVEFGRSGRRYGKADMLVAPEAGQEIDAMLPFPDYDVSIIAPGVALVTYTSVVRYGGKVERSRRASLWTKASGWWRLRFHQGTPI